MRMTLRGVPVKRKGPACNITRSKASPYRVAPTDGPMGVVADSLDEAKAAFRAARCERPLSPEKADEKCSI